MEKRISFRDFQSVKSIAKAIDPKLSKRSKLADEINGLIKEYQSVDREINLLEAGIVETIGFHVSDLVQKVIEPTGKFDKNGKALKDTKYLPTSIVSYDEQAKEYVITAPEATETAQPSVEAPTQEPASEPVSTPETSGDGTPSNDSTF